MSDINFFDFVNEKYKDYGDTKDSLIKAYICYSENDDHHFFSEHIKEHFNNAFGNEYWSDHVSAKKIAKKISGEAKEVLCQLIKGPVFDGDVASKSGKAELYSFGLALRVCNKGDFGDNAANRMGWLVYSEIENNS